MWQGTPSQAADVDHRQVYERGWKDVAVVMDLNEFFPVGGRAQSE